MIKLPYLVSIPEGSSQSVDFDSNNHQLVSDTVLLSYNDCINLQALAFGQNRGQEEIPTVISATVNMMKMPFGND